MGVWHKVEGEMFFQHTQLKLAEILDGPKNCKYKNQEEIVFE